MITRFTFSLVLLLPLSLLQILTFTLAITSAPFNISHFLYPKISDELRSQPSLFLKDVLEVISEEEKWKLEDVRVSKLELAKVKYGNLQRYEIRIRFGKSDLVFGLWDEVSLWKKFKDGGDFESLVKVASSNVVLDSFRVEGPFELLVSGDDELLLMLPLNTSHTGLKRILVGEGITVEVKSAQEVSLLHTSDLGLPPNRSPMTNRKHTSEFWFFPRLLCMPLLPIKIFGSASVVAYRTRNPGSHIESAFLSRETIELLPEKCYSRHTYKKQKCPIESLRLRISLLEKLLRSFLGDRIDQNAVWGFFKAKIQASTVFRFQLELERDIRSNDTRRTTMAEWRTRPTVERVWYEVLARIDTKKLKPLIVRKVKPFIGVDSSAWSNLMSNISFTKFPSVLVPPESLTLDVKW